MTESQLIIVFHGRHFVRHLGICNPICVKLLQIMSGVISRNLKQKLRLYLNPFSWGPQTQHTHTHTDRETDRQTHTHDDGIRRNAMRCISPKNDVLSLCIKTLKLSSYFHITAIFVFLSYSSILFSIFVMFFFCFCYFPNTHSYYAYLHIHWHYRLLCM